MLEELEKLKERIGCDRLTIQLQGDRISVKADVISTGWRLVRSWEKVFSLENLNRGPTEGEVEHIARTFQGFRDSPDPFADVAAEAGFKR